MRIEEATAVHWPAIWPFLHRIIAAGETYTYDPDLGEAEARALWMPPPPAHTVVAVADDGTVLGSARIRPNQGGPGSHVANASYVVDPDHAGRGVGRALCEYSLDWAARAGYRAMQFNAVVETNTAAVALYRKLGFTVVGTVPEAFDHPRHGLVGLHIMYRRLGGGG